MKRWHRGSAYVVFANASPERVIADLSPKHVQRPPAFLIDDVVEDLFHIGQIVVQDGLGGRAEGFIAAAFEAGLERVRALVMLGVEQREAGGEAFAEPDVVPVFFRDGIAEPLVCDFVSDQAGRGL